MKINTYLLTASCLLLLFIAFRPSFSSAQNNTFSGVYPFTTTQGLGLFDQNTGKIYVYDSDFKTCLYQGQIESLGDAAVTLNKENPTRVKTYDK